MKGSKMNKLIIFLSMCLLVGFWSCGSDSNSNQQSNTAQQTEQTDGLSQWELEHGIGPVKEKIELGEINMELAAKGEESFIAKCAPCHKLDKRFIGPAQRYTADRRTPEYILNMILNPDEMTKRHPTGKKLLAEYLAPMTNMNLTLDQAKEILEYLRAVAKEGHEKNIVADPVFKSAQ